jgi:hypothetical protein
VGGIAGGWAAGGAYYLGRIEDCVYTGSITGSISNVGGIAGALGGNGGDAADEANTSRILRCRTAGSVKKITGTYAGGIVGEVSNGALVARSSSNTAIEGFSYAGGIAASITARISDCWSDGTVQGGTQAGGIARLAGTSTIERCYSRAGVSIITTSTWAVGGICAASLPSGTSVTLCVALNNTISSPEISGATLAKRVKRIFGCSTVGAAIGTGVAMNYAPEIPITGPDPMEWAYDAQKDGAILDEEPPGQWLYEVTLGWDFDEVWIMGGDGYPRLRGVDSN